MSVPPPAGTTIGERYEAVRARIARAGGHDVAVIAVTKALDSSAIDAAAACGIGHIGENYAQECLAKLTGVTAMPKPRVHFIGRVQRNKVKMLAGCVDVWQTVDRPELAGAIEKAFTYDRPVVLDVTTDLNALAPLAVTE